MGRVAFSGGAREVCKRCGMISEKEITNQCVVQQ